MATIKARRQANGSIRYTAIVRRRVGKTIIHCEAKTFTHRSVALSWARHREIDLENPAALTRKQHGTVTLADLIRWYIDTFETISKWQRSKQTHLEFLERHPIGKANALTLTAAMLIDHVRSRRADGAGPATVINDLVWIGVVLRAAKNVQELPVRPEITQHASGACRELRLISKPRRRARRPTPDELARLREYFASRDRRAQIPMQAIVDFAIASARREAEICRIEWRDNDAAARTGLVRDAKRVGAAFTRACHVLGIEDLRFHDLRHEATSQLFERGYQIHEVAQFTLHESWNELKRYTNLKPESVRELKAPEALTALRPPGRQAIVVPAQPPSRAGRQSTRRDRPH